MTLHAVLRQPEVNALAVLQSQVEPQPVRDITRVVGECGVGNGRRQIHISVKIYNLADKKLRPPPN